MSYESKFCRSFIDITDVAKNSLIVELLAHKDNLGLSDEQMSKITRIVSLTLDGTKEAGLSAFQRLGIEVDKVIEGKVVEVKEANGKEKPKNSKSEAV